MPLVMGTRFVGAAVIAAIGFLLVVAVPGALARRATSGWRQPLVIGELGPSGGGNTNPVQLAVGSAGRALITVTNVGADGDGIQAVLGSVTGHFARMVWVARDATLGGYNPTVVSSAIDGRGRALVLWQQAPGRRLMLSVAPAGRRLQGPVAIPKSAGASMWNLVASRHGPVVVEWVNDGRMLAGRVGKGGVLTGVRTIASGVIGNQVLAIDDHGDLAALWGPSVLGQLTWLTTCPVVGGCSTQRAPVQPQFGGVALLPDGTALVAGSQSPSGDGIAVSQCLPSERCSAPHVLARTGQFPDFVVDDRGRATLAWQDDQSSDGFLSSAVLPPGAARFSAVTKVRARVGGLLASIAANAEGDVLAGWQPAVRPSVPPPPMEASFAPPSGRLRTFTRVSAGHPSQPVAATSDPAVGLGPTGDAILVWSSAGRSRTLIDVALGRPRP
jgi:hypothetical protein